MSNRFTSATDHREQAVDMDMMRVIGELYFMAGRKVEAFRAEYNDLVKENIRLRAEITQLESTHPQAWTSHLRNVQAQVEEIYTQFKALDTEVRADYATVKEQFLADQKESENRHQGKEKGEKAGIHSACLHYVKSIGQFFSEVEQFHQDLANLPDQINQQPIEENIPIVLPVEEVSEPQEERTLENISNPIVAALAQDVQHKLNEQIEPIRQNYLVSQEENKRLQEEKTLRQSMYAQKLASCHAYLKKHLTLPENRDPVPNSRDWEQLHSYQMQAPHRAWCLQSQTTDPGLIYTHASIFKKLEKVEKIMSRWEEIAGLINTLLTQ